MHARRRDNSIPGLWFASCINGSEMLFETLTFLASEVNAYLNEKLLPTSDPRLKVGNISLAFDSLLTGANSVNDKAVMTLVNLEEDRASRSPDNFVKSTTEATYKNPPVVLNLYVMFSIFRTDYDDCLKWLGHIVQFFQYQPTFTPLTHPSLDARIEKLTVELYTMNFEQLNHIWSTLGGKYLPSALYKVRQLSLDENAVRGESGLIKEIQLSERSMGAVS